MLVPRAVGFRPHQQSSCTCSLGLADKAEGLVGARVQAPSPRCCQDPPLPWEAASLSPAHCTAGKSESGQRNKKAHAHLADFPFWCFLCSVQISTLPPLCHLFCVVQEGKKVTSGHGPTWARLSCCSATPHRSLLLLGLSSCPAASIPTAPLTSSQGPSLRRVWCLYWGEGRHL